MLLVSGDVPDNNLTRKKTGLIESVYSTILDPGAWESFLKKLVDATCSRSARMLVMNPAATRVTASLKINIDDHYHQQYVNHYVNCCPWRPELSRMNPGRLYSTYLHFSCPQHDFYKTEFYNEWARGQDIHHGMCGTVFSDSGQTVQLLIQRTRDQHHYTEEDTAFVNDLVPHIQHSFQLAGQVYNGQARAGAISIAAATEAKPFVLLNRHLKIVYCSIDAEDFLRREGLLRVAKNRLRIDDALYDRNFNRLLRQCLKSAESRNMETPVASLCVPRCRKPAVHLLVRPVHPDIPVVVGEPDVYLAVYLCDPAARVKLSPDRLSRLYSLSGAETRVVLALVATTDSAEAAAKCHISLHTLRSHLKSIFAKTETRNRAELIKRLLTGPARLY